MVKENLIDIFSNIFRDNWDRNAVQDFNTETRYTYHTMSKKIAELHIIYREAGIEKGDKIAILGKNSSHWAISFIATITYGAIVVPILEDFNPRDITHILNHSGAKMLLSDSTMWKNLNEHDLPELMFCLTLKDFSTLKNSTDIDLDRSMKNMCASMKELYPNGFSKQDVKYDAIDNSEFIILNYTSGTTSFTKGVMIMANNIAGNMVAIRDIFIKTNRPLKSTVCVLPLAHTFGLTIGFLVHIIFGAEVTFLSRVPSPKVLLDACAKTKPTVLVFVPLILEKIYKNNIAPQLNSGLIAKLRKIPFLDTIIHRRIGKKLYKMFGGALYEIAIGGASTNPEVEDFLMKAKFPITVGYGLTECAPLITYTPSSDFRKRSAGQILEGYMEVRIEKENPNDKIGEIYTRGENVMKGYYNDEEATKNTFTEDGWMKTGDLGYVDEDNFIYLKGRNKTMILGPSGENIYPEAIESKLNNMPFIAESIVMQNDNNKLIAFVYPDFSMIEKAKISLDKLNRLMANNRRTINEITAKYENIQRIVVVDEPFIKTPKNTPKRYGLQYLLDKYYKDSSKS